MDQIERSFQEEQTNLADRIRIARESHPTLKPTGYCQNDQCLEDLPDDKLFCDCHCADQYQQSLKRRGRVH